MSQPPQFAAQGAVDLGARQAMLRRQEAAREAAESGEQPGYVVEVTDATFNAEVVARSRMVPVVLDLWAEWCGPCKQLGPVLEKLAAEGAGAWVLAKVDVDANPQISASLRVQSIPMVVAVVGGQPVDAFLGAQPEQQVRAWIEQILAAAEQLGVGGAAGDRSAATGAGRAAEAVGAQQGIPPSAGTPSPGPAGAGVSAGGSAATAPTAELSGIDADFAQAQQAMERGDLDAAAAALERVLTAVPGEPSAKMGLAQVELVRRVGSYDQAKARRDADDRPSDPEAQARVADIDLAMGRMEAAFERMLKAVRTGGGDDRELARAHLVRLFEVLPPGDPRVAKARAQLSSLLF